MSSRPPSYRQGSCRHCPHRDKLLRNSVFAHKANIDALWDNTIAPIVRTRFPEASPMLEPSQVANNRNLTNEGQAEQLAGKVQEKVGQVEKVFEK